MKPVLSAIHSLMRNGGQALVPVKTMMTCTPALLIGAPARSKPARLRTLVPDRTVTRATQLVTLVHCRASGRPLAVSDSNQGTAVPLSKTWLVSVAMKFVTLVNGTSTLPSACWMKLRRVAIQDLRPSDDAAPTPAFLKAADRASSQGWKNSGAIQRAASSWYAVHQKRRKSGWASAALKGGSGK